MMLFSPLESPESPRFVLPVCLCCLFAGNAPVSINEASVQRLTVALSAIMAENIVQIRESRPFDSMADCST